MSMSDRKLLTIFTANLDAELERRGWTDAELGERSGVYRSRLSKWRSGEGSPNLTHLIRIADALGVTIDGLARGVFVPNKPPVGKEQQILLDVVFDGPTPIGLAEALRRIANSPANGTVPASEPVDAPLIAGPAVRKRGRPRRKNT